MPRSQTSLWWRLNSAQVAEGPAPASAPGDNGALSGRHKTPRQWPPLICCCSACLYGRPLSGPAVGPVGGGQEVGAAGHRLWAASDSPAIKLSSTVSPLPTSHRQERGACAEGRPGWAEECTGMDSGEGDGVKSVTVHLQGEAMGTAGASAEGDGVRVWQCTYMGRPWGRQGRQRRGTVSECDSAPTWGGHGDGRGVSGGGRCQSVTVHLHGYDECRCLSSPTPPPTPPHPPSPFSTASLA